MEKYGIIYRITNLINGKCYIGQTKEKNPLKRIRSHFNKYPKPHPLRNSIKCHGKENFKWDILVTAFDKKGLDDLEILLIKENRSLLPNGYNIQLGGNGPGKMTQATKDKISKSNKEWNKNNVAYNKGRKFTKEHCENLSKVRKGFTSMARREAQKISIEKVSMPVRAIHIETGEVYTFKSLSECAKELGLQGCNVSRVLNKKQNRSQHKGYKFERIE